jgi:hypothetical protein
MKICIERFETNEHQTLSKVYVYDREGALIANCYALELPWRGNERRVSCIPSGTYPAVLHTSPRFGKSIWIKEVPGRSEILIHKGNFNHDTLGCPLLGENTVDINGDGQLDVTNSTNTVKKVIDAIKENLYDDEDITVQVLWVNENPEEENTEEAQEDQSDEDTEGPGGEIPQEDDEEGGPA